MMKPFLLLIAVHAMDNIFKTVDTCLSCLEDYEKDKASQQMVAVRHNQPHMNCTHHIYCTRCYDEDTALINQTLRKNIHDDYVRNCPLDRQSGRLLIPENIGDGIHINLLNPPLNQQHRAALNDSLTQHLIINSTILLIIMSVWIAMEPHSQLTKTWAKLGYVLQMLVRNYFGYVTFAGLIYSFYDDLFKWKNAEYPWKLKPTYIMLYLFTITTSILMLGRQALQSGEAGEMSSTAAVWTDVTSWFAMIGGLLIGIYSHILQKKTIFQHKRFSHFEFSQPEEKLCGNIVSNQRFDGYLLGVLATFIPFFSLFQGITILYLNHVSPDVYNKGWHKPAGGKGGPEWATVAGAAGIVIGSILTLIGQSARYCSRIGTFTLGNFMLTGISWFLSFHADPDIGIYIPFAEFIFIVICLILAFSR